MEGQRQPIERDPGNIVFTRRWKSGVKALTLVGCTYTFVACLLVDWEHMFGENHVFSGVKPVLRSYINSIYGSSGPSDAAAAAVGGSAASSSGGGGAKR
jgi:hypothetical protein